MTKYTHQIGIKARLVRSARNDKANLFYLIFLFKLGFTFGFNFVFNLG